MADFQIIRKAVDEIERTLRDFSLGWRNEDALHNIESQARTIRSEASSMTYIDEKLSSLLDWVEKLYSPKK